MFMCVLLWFKKRGKNNIKKPHVLFTPFHPMSTSCKTIVQYIRTWILTLIQSSCRTNASPQGSFVLLFYNHTPLPSSSASPYPLQSTNLFSISILCHFKSVVEMDLYHLYGTDFFFNHMVLWRFIQVLGYITSLFFFTADCYSLVQMYHN